MKSSNQINTLTRQVLEQWDEGEEAASNDSIERKLDETTAMQDDEAPQVQHLYLLSAERLRQLLAGEEEGDESVNVVESDVAVPSEPTTEPDPVISPPPVLQREPEPITFTPLPARRAKARSLLVPLLVLVLVVGSGTLSALVLLPTLASAQITLVPSTRALHQVLTLPLVTQQTRGAETLPGRLLPVARLSASQTVPATGTGHQDATAASGVLTFFNGMLAPVSIPQGTILQGAGGVQVITEATVTVQQATPPQEGEASVYAHALLVGAQGNLAANAIHGPCCGSISVLAANLTPFSGGMDERSYRYVTSSDIGNAAEPLTHSLTAQAMASLTASLHQGESLLPPVCTSQTSSSSQPGEQATAVTVTVAETCRSMAYRVLALQGVVSTLLVSSHPGLHHFRQAGPTALTITGVTMGPTSARLTVSATGTWVYAFSAADLSHLKRLIGGLSPAQAQAVLQTQTGIEQASIQVHRVDLGDLLPTDPQQMTIQLLDAVS